MRVRRRRVRSPPRRLRHRRCGCGRRARRRTARSSDAPSPCSASARRRCGRPRPKRRSTGQSIDAARRRRDRAARRRRRSSDPGEISTRRRATAPRVGAAMAAKSLEPGSRGGRACLTPRSRVTVNGTSRTAAVEPRKTLADFLREDCRLTGTHLGCEHGVCGACTVLSDGAAVRACLMFAVQADGREVTTVEGLAPPDGELSAVQQRLARSPRPAVRLLHAGVRRVDHRLPRATTPIRPTRRSATVCPATCAAAPATRASSPRSGWRRRRGTAMTGDGPPPRRRRATGSSASASSAAKTPGSLTGHGQLRRRHRRARACCTPPSCAATSPGAPMRSIDVSAARDLPGVVAVFTGGRPQRRCRRELGRLRGARCVRPGRSACSPTATCASPASRSRS